ncbi:MAG: PD40 domain-containing protein [Bacteroidia bacterium]|nr:PD40 domain-containing protein [Bacteroidia bacterium]MBP7771064.1 PD40 domain-containing protein [Bacteroidia bacterium]
MYLRILFILTGLLLTQVVVSGQNQANSESELRKRADKLFQDQEYLTAVGPYSQLLSLQPNDATLNYRYGTALLLSGKDKRNAVSYLEKAMNDPAQPMEGWVYLGRSYMFLGKYEDAKSCFNRFNTRATDAQRKKFNSEEWLRSAGAASELSRQRRMVSVTAQKEVLRSAAYSQIDYTNAAGRILPVPEKFQTTADKDKQAAPVMYLSRDGQTIYYASYGKGSVGGKDLYLIRKMTNGEWAQPEHLGSVLNSVYNEDYPFLDRDGKTLYFASQGHNSIGGYDIFKSVFNFNTGQWSAPENLGIPVNTPDDDLLYVPGSDGVTAVYTTADFTDNTHTEIRTIHLDDQRNPFATIRGTYYSIDQPMRRDARVIVLRAADRSVVTTVRTDPRTGGYELVLPGGESYWLVIDGGGYVPHTESFDLPAGLEKAALRQEVRMNRNKQEELMTVTNFFTPMPSAIGADVIAVNDRPSSTETSATTPSSETVQISVGNETLIVSKPVSQPVTSPEQAGEVPVTADQAADEDTSLADNYNPLLDREMTQDEIRQRQEEQLRSEEVVADEKIPAEQLHVPVDEHELARSAVEDGVALQREADSLQDRSRELYASAANREEEAVRLLEEAQSIKEDTVRAANLYLQSDDMKQMALAEKQQARELDGLATERRAEAKQALTDAKALISSTNTKDKELSASVDRALAGTSEKASVTASSPSAAQGVTSPSLEPMAEQAVEVRTEGVSSTANPTSQTTPAAGQPQAADEEQLATTSPNQQEQNQTAATTSRVSPDSNDSGVVAVQQNVSEESQPTADFKRGHAAESSGKETGKPVVGTNPEGSSVSEKNTADVLAAGTNPAITASDEHAANDKQSVIEPETTVNATTKPEGLPEQKAQQSADERTVAIHQASEEQPKAEPNAMENRPKDQATSSGEPVVIAGQPTRESESRQQPTANQPSAGKSKDDKVAATTGTSQPTSSTAANATTIRSTDDAAQSVPVAVNADGAPVSPQTTQNTDRTRATTGTQTGSTDRSTSATRLTMVPAMEGVSEETRLAYQNYKQRMEFSSRLDERSKELQTQVATMKNSPERDSLIQLSNSMSMESIRQWQSAQQQLQLAKADDPEIQTKAETAIATAKAAEPPSEPVVTSQELATVANPVRSDAVPTGESAARTGVSGNQSANTNRADRSEQPAGTQPATSGQVSAIKTDVEGTNQLSVTPTTPSVEPASGEVRNDGQLASNASGNQAADRVSNDGEGQRLEFSANNPNEPRPVSGGDGAPATSTGEISRNESRQGAISPSAEQGTTTARQDRSDATPAAGRGDEQAVATKPSTIPSGAERAGQVVANPDQTPGERPASAERSNPVSKEAAPTVSGQETVTNQSERQESVRSSETQESGGQRNSNAVQTATDRTRIADNTEPAVTPANAVSNTPTNTTTQAADNRNTVNEQQPGAMQQPAQPATSQVELVYDTASVRSKLQSNEDVPVAQLDSSHKDFPRYLKLRQEVGEKQDETIRLFSSAIELNKKASQEKEEQVDLMQKAEATADANEKAKLLRSAEKRKHDSEEHEAEAGKLMAQAQKLSDEIWENNQSLEALSLAIRKSGPARTSPATTPGTSGTTTTDIRPATIPEMDETVRAESSVSIQQTGNDRAPVKAGPLTVPGIERMVVRSDKPAYTDTAPIPVDQPLPEGLVFKVQIGAFRKPIPNEAFGGLSPVSGENTRPGWIRYCVGLFRTFEPANLVKKAMRGQGFKDAFVVAYFNGKRISLGEAYAMLNQAGSDSRATYASVSREELQRLKALNIVPQRTSAPDRDEQEFFGGTTSASADGFGTGTAYAVQVGVYRSSIPPAVLGSLQPLQQEALQRGLFRYTTGRYQVYASADSMRRVAVAAGIPDAFVVAYRDGRRVSLSNARRSETGTSGSTVVRPQPAASTPAAQPAVETGAITFRVQVGAFRQQVPFQVVDALLKVSDRGVEREQDPRGLQVFFAGRFSDYESARKLKEEVVGRGVPDAFVVAFSGTKRIPLAEALRQVGQ